MLDRRSFLTAMAAAAAFAVAGPALAQGIVEGPKVNWKLSTWGPARAQTAGIERLAELVKERTNGNFIIDIGFAEQYAPAKEGLDSVKIGVVDGAQISSSYHPGKNPVLNALDLPFLPMANADARIAVHEAFYAHPEVQKELARWGAMYYASAILPPYEFMGRGPKPLTLEDWSGKRVRALGGMGDAMRVLGAVPTTVPAPEVYTALERGVVDAASFPYTYAHAAYRLHEISNWFTSNMNVGVANVATIFSKASWDRLPQQYQDLLMELKEPHYEALKAAFQAADDKNLPMFREQGLEEIRYSDERLKEFQERAAKPIWDRWVKSMSEKGVPAQELLDLILTTGEKASKSSS